MSYSRIGSGASGSGCPEVCESLTICGTVNSMTAAEHATEARPMRGSASSVLLDMLDERSATPDKDGQVVVTGINRTTTLDR